MAKTICTKCGKTELTGQDAIDYNEFVDADMSMGPCTGFDYEEANDICICPE